MADDDLKVLAQALNDAEKAGVRRGITEGERRARRDLEQEREQALQANVESYRDGTVAEGQCAAVAPGVLRDGQPVRCILAQGHPLSQYERHKALFGEPHLAVVWNETDAA